MTEYAKYLNWVYRASLLRMRDEIANHGIINKLNRKIRKYEATH